MENNKFFTQAADWMDNLPRTAKSDLYKVRREEVFKINGTKRLKAVPIDRFRNRVFLNR